MDVGNNNFSVLIFLKSFLRRLSGVLETYLLQLHEVHELLMNDYTIGQVLLMLPFRLLRGYSKVCTHMVQYGHTYIYLLSECRIMGIANIEYEEYRRANIRISFDPDVVPFVSKIYKTKTRKDKDYYVLRMTIPKKIARKIDVNPGDYVFSKMKKAQWYHMLDWNKMGEAWDMLPQATKDKIMLEGMDCPDSQIQPLNLIPGMTSPMLSGQNDIRESLSFQSGGV